MPLKKTAKFAARLLRRLVVLLGAVAMTLALFLVLPLMQALTASNPADMVLQTVDAADLPPPPPPPPEKEEEEKEPEPEEKPPVLAEEAPPLDLSQLELALNPGMGGDGVFAGDFAPVSLKTVVAQQGGSGDELFSVADLDQPPRVVYQPGPSIDAPLRRKLRNGAITVYIIFIVDQRGRVENPLVQKADDPAFEKPALNAVRQWRFDPGKRGGQAVRFRMRVPITFPKE